MLVGVRLREKGEYFSTPLKYNPGNYSTPLAQYARRWQLNKPIGYDLRERADPTGGISPLALIICDYDFAGGVIARVDTSPHLL